MTRRRVFIGLVLVVLGVIVWIDRLKGANEAHEVLHFLDRWKALALLSIGAVNLVGFLRPRWWVAGPTLLIGASLVWLAASRSRLPPDADRFALPIVLIGIGLITAMSGVEGIANDDGPGRLRSWAVLRGRRVLSRVRDLQQGSAGALLGQLELDLRQTTLDEGNGELAITAICGHVELLVPREWSVELKRSVGFRVRMAKPSSDEHSSTEGGSGLLEVYLLAVAGSAEIRPV